MADEHCRPRTFPVGTRQVSDHRQAVHIVDGLPRNDHGRNAIESIRCPKAVSPSAEGHDPSFNLLRQSPGATPAQTSRGRTRQVSKPSSISHWRATSAGSSPSLSTFAFSLSITSLVTFGFN